MIPQRVYVELGIQLQSQLHEISLLKQNQYRLACQSVLLGVSFFLSSPDGGGDRSMFPVL